VARFAKPKEEKEMRAPKPEPKPKKEPTGAQIRARLKNLERANEVAAKKKRERELAKIDAKLNDLTETVDDKVAEQVEKRLKKLDRGKLKDEVLQVFYDMGGAKALKKWAKANPTKYYSMMSAIIKAESDKEQGSGSGVVVNFFGMEELHKTINITPDKQTISIGETDP
jgi:hypothetical protein